MFCVVSSQGQSHENDPMTKSEEREAELAEYQCLQKLRPYNEDNTGQQNNNEETKKLDHAAKTSKITMYAQDPLFTPFDVVFLRSVGVEVIPCEGNEAEKDNIARDKDGFNACDRHGDVDCDNATATTPTTPTNGQQYRATNNTKTNKEALEEIFHRLNLGSDTSVGSEYKGYSNKSEITLNSHMDANSDCITTTGPSTFFFAPFLEHNILLRRILRPYLCQQSQPLTHFPYTTGSTSQRPTSPSTTIPTNTAPTSCLASNTTNYTRQSTASTPTPGPALYIGTDIAEVLEAFTQRIHKQREENETGTDTEKTKDNDFTYYIPRRQKRRQKQQKRYERQQQQYYQQGEERKDDDMLVAASRTFLTSRSRRDAFPVFEPFPLAFKGLWIYLG